MTPYLKMLGREVCLPVDINFKTSAPPVNHGEYVGKLLEKLQRANTIARQKTKTSIEEQDKSSDIEQQPPLSDSKHSNTLPSVREGVTIPTGTSYNLDEV